MQNRFTCVLLCFICYAKRFKKRLTTFVVMYRPKRASNSSYTLEICWLKQGLPFSGCKQLLIWKFVCQAEDVLLGPVHTAPFTNESGAKFFHFCPAFTLLRCENRAFENGWERRKRKYLKTPHIPLYRLLIIMAFKLVIGAFWQLLATRLCFQRVIDNTVLLEQCRLLSYS